MMSIKLVAKNAAIESILLLFPKVNTKIRPVIIMKYNIIVLTGRTILRRASVFYLLH